MYKYDGLVMTLGLIILIVSLLGAAAGAQPLRDAINDDTNMEWVSGSFTETINGNTNENSDTEETITVAYEVVTSVEATLSWTDETPSGIGSARLTNEPDSFSVGIESPPIVDEENGLEEQSSPSSSGTVSVKITVPEETEIEPGDWTITVSAGDCGDVYGLGGIRLVDQDTGNAWVLTVKVNYEEYVEVENDTTVEETIFAISPAYRIYRFLYPYL